jgi:hypothetical protein
MPYAFTGDQPPTMGDDYCYVGFETTSPWLKDPPSAGWTSTGYKYGYYPYNFYSYALGFESYGWHQTIINSLDYAARSTFGTKNYQDYTYETSILYIGEWKAFSLQGMEGWWYWRMRVFGDWDMILPEY